jgi:acyl-coenzyme A synthetase/AMP-(fatty) acid ligase
LGADGESLDQETQGNRASAARHAYTAVSYARHILKLAPDDLCLSISKIYFAYGFGNSIAFPFAVGVAGLLLR